jgi:HPt (histidine-containing phosphotransfer) domain-containing protein
MDKSYDVNRVAQELGLEPEDLKDVYDIYFEETAEALEKCEHALQAKEEEELGKLFHGLKGAANNLRLEAMGNMAKSGEERSKERAFAQIVDLLTGLRQEMAVMRQQVEAFYNR